MPLATRRPFGWPASGVRGAAPAAPPRPAPAAPVRQRTFVLDVPYELRDLPQRYGARWDPGVKAHTWRGAVLPEELVPYRCVPYSWERFREDEINGVEPAPSVPEGGVRLRPHQREAADAVRRALSADKSCFLLADDVGLGKTISAWTAVREMADVETVLVVCPLAVVAHWRRTVAWLGDGGLRVCVINYDRLRKLFDAPPPPAKDGRKRKRKLRSLARSGDARAFDVVLFDEAHRLRNPEAARTRLAGRLAAAAGFVMWLSATAGQNPLELSYLAPLLAEASGSRERDLADYAKWCQARGIGVRKGAYGRLEWIGTPPCDPLLAGRIARDLETIRGLLFGGRVPLGLRRSPVDIAGWPEINRILMPVALEPDDRRLYEEAWTEFRRQLDLERRGGRDSKSALVARLRFRQKASLLRTAGTLDLVLDLLAQGQQVAVSVAFRETMEVLREALEREGEAAALIHGGQGAAEKEAQRLDFQHGRRRVVLYTVEEGISLHQGEHNDAPRSNVIHDLRWSSIAQKQIEGRTHRDGRFSRAYWMFGADTVEERIARVVAARMLDMSRMQGDDSAAVEELLAGLGG